MDRGLSQTVPRSKIQTFRLVDENGFPAINTWHLPGPNNWCPYEESETLKYAKRIEIVGVPSFETTSTVRLTGEKKRPTDANSANLRPQRAADKQAKCAEIL